MLVLLALLSRGAEARTFYFSSSQGNDSRSDREAQEAITPWKSLEKLNACFFKIQPGDSILFKCGDIFFGTIDLQNSGREGISIVFSSYGKGSLPVITGLIQPGHWKQTGSMLWEAEAGIGPALHAVVIKGLLTPCGRYPNATDADKGYLPILGFNGSSAITVKDSRSWAGGDVVIRKNHWVLDRNPILESKGSSISYATASVYMPEQGNGYFIENHPATLDQNGEWYYNRNTRKISLFYNTDPEKALIQVATKETLLNLSGQHDLIFENLVFTGSNANALQLNGCQRIQFIHCTVSCSGKNAIEAHRTEQLVIKDCLVWQTNNIAFRGEELTGAMLIHNTIRQTGIHAGMGEGDSGSYEAILINGNENTIGYNRIDSTGYIPISFSGNSIHITHNYITSFALVKDDAGGIYTWNNRDHAPVNRDRIIDGNIILGGKGAPEGIGGHSATTAHGIYIDDNSAFVKLVNNTVARCTGYGIYIHNAHDITIRQNTVFDNAVQLELASDHSVSPQPEKHISVRGNIFFSKLGSQPVAEFKSADNSILGFGEADSNRYVRPFEESSAIHVVTGVNSSSEFKQYSLSAWKALTGYDIHSAASPLHLDKYHNLGKHESIKLGNFTFDSNTDGAYAWSAAGNMKIEWSRGPLDGGTLKLFFSPLKKSGSHGSMIIKTGHVMKGKYYQLRFSCLGDNPDKIISAYLRQSTGSYKDLSERELFSSSDQRTDQKVIFLATSTEMDASIVFDIEEQRTPLYFDSISLMEIQGNQTDANSLMKLYINPSPITRVFKLDKPGRDIRNKLYASELRIFPFSSFVLIFK